MPTPCPVLNPSIEEFTEPIAYLSLEKVLALGQEHGLVKIIPPPQWKPPFSLASTFTFHTRIQKLSDLGITSRSRRFFIDNLNRFMVMAKLPKLNEFFFCRERKIHYYDLYIAVTNVFANQVKTPSLKQIRELNHIFGIDSSDPILVDVYKKHLLLYAEHVLSRGSFDFPSSNVERLDDSCVICLKSNSPTTTLLCDNCDEPYHMRCLLPPLLEVPSGIWYCEKCIIGTGEYGFEENAEVKFTLMDFVDYCQKFDQKFFAQYGFSNRMSIDDIERIFWRLVEKENSDLKVRYGADIHNSKPGEITGFPTASTPSADEFSARVNDYYAKHPWNLTRLPFAKGSLLNNINTEISGMTVPWLYVGSLLSTFCWHVEDHYTLSANYCHFGNTKKWYGIPSSHADQFEEYMKSLAPDLFQRQPDLLHQLVTLISPSELAKISIPCTFADQQANEFVVTFPRVYHAGFNSGFNFNEAVNFTMDSWLDFGERAISDYRKIRKENVFDHYNLLENVLSSFVSESAHMWQHRLELVAKCIRSFEMFISKQESYVSNFSKERLEKLEIQKQSVEDDDDEDNLCDICRLSVTYQYCNINNRSHRFGKWPLGRAKKEDNRNEISKLLTPEPSPYTAQSAERKLSVAQAVSDLKTAGALKAFSDEVVTHSDEFEKLIGNAKRKSREEDVDVKPKRRQSKRIQGLGDKSGIPEKEEAKAPEILAKPKRKTTQFNALLHQLNQYDNVRLCLECTAEMCGKQAEMAPKGSLVVMKKNFEDMKKVCALAKSKFTLMTDRLKAEEV